MSSVDTAQQLNKLKAETISLINFYQKDILLSDYL